MLHIKNSNIQIAAPLAIDALGEKVKMRRSVHGFPSRTPKTGKGRRGCGKLLRVTQRGRARLEPWLRPSTFGSKIVTFLVTKTEMKILRLHFLPRIIPRLQRFRTVQGKLNLQPSTDCPHIESRAFSRKKTIPFLATENAALHRLWIDLQKTYEISKNIIQIFRLPCRWLSTHWAKR